MEAELDFAKLRDEGLRVFIVNQHTASILPHYSMAIGGVKIQIHVNDFEKGLQAISYERNNEKDVDELFQNPSTQQSLICPRCGSSNYFREKSVIAGLFFLILAVIAVSIPKKDYHCTKCDHRWKVT
jgi:predicted nucleic-acid-binding Zn-ribbon protein